METAAPIQQEERRNEGHKVQINSSALCSSLVHQIIHQKDARREGKKRKMTTDESRAMYLFEQKNPRLVRQKLRARLIFHWYKRKMGNAREGMKGKNRESRGYFAALASQKNIGLQEHLR
jgi:hypothetical protein